MLCQVWRPFVGLCRLEPAAQIWSFWRFWPRAWRECCWSEEEAGRSSPSTHDGDATPWHNILSIFPSLIPKADVEMWTFECKRSLFYSCRILGRNRVHIQYTPIRAIRVSSSRGRTVSIHLLLRHVWLLGCSRSEVTPLRRLCLLTRQIFILLQRFILAAHLYLFIYCWDISPLRWVKCCFRVWTQRWTRVAVFAEGVASVLIQV